jgi:signal transduction histidine kinase/CheY-like chemotaxis protein/HPt (histidine-containing phosphotransfer) domain-containing protein
MTDTFPIHNSSNEFTHIGSIVVDITDKVKREEELIAAQQASETSKQLLKSFMDNATSAMFAKDENGTYIITNKKKEEYESLREFSRLDPDLDPIQFYNSELSRIDDARVIAQNTAMTFYDRLLDIDGSVIYTETVKFPIYDKHSGLIGVGGITKDITEIVIREKELEEAKQRAEDAANSQERFLASMSHDMRTPLNGVVGMINLLEQTSLSAEQKEYMEAMKVSSYNLRVLINDILDISKIQAGKLNIEYVLFDLNEILTSVNNVFSHEASRKGVLFSVELPSDTPVMLEGDPSRLSQILNNLIGNALKFTAEGFVKLKLQHENLADDKVNIEFAIEDSGIGISEDGLGKLFQPFVQASSDTTRKFGGSGLGLSICKSLVELQQGEIGVSSTLGKGSIFHFSIPYAKAKQVKIGRPKQNNNATEFKSAQPLPSMRCLVFEDNMINQKVTFHTLKKVGVSADMANNGKIGIEILRKDAILYDFVLMDIQMPEMDGYEATTVIRNELGLKVPIIAMTASALKGEKEHCIEVGMNDFVPKPFVIDELLYVIRKLIRKGQEDEITPQLADEVADDTAKSEVIKQQTGFGNEPLYDMTNVLEMEDDDFTLEILNTFLDTVPKALEELKMGITQTNDWDTVTKVAHKLKGGVGVLQMNEMIEQLATIEINAKCRENLDQLAEAVDVCCQIYDVVKDEITKQRDETKTKM